MAHRKPISYSCNEKLEHFLSFNQFKRLKVLVDRLELKLGNRNLQISDLGFSLISHTFSSSQLFLSKTIRFRNGTVEPNIRKIDNDTKHIFLTVYDNPTFIFYHLRRSPIDKFNFYILLDGLVPTYKFDSKQFSIKCLCIQIGVTFKKEMFYVTV